MKKPKFNIGDKVGATIKKEVDGVLLSGYIEWYVLGVFMDFMEISESQSGDDMRGYSYCIGSSVSVYDRIKHFQEKELTLLEKAQYEDE